MHGMVGVLQEFRPCFHGLQDAALSFFAQLFVRCVFHVGDQQDQALRLVGVEVIDDEPPFFHFSIAVDRPFDVFEKIHFVARIGDGRADDFPFDHVPVCDEAFGAVSLIFVFLFAALPGDHGFVGSGPLECLDARFFIGADGLDALFFPFFGCFEINLANLFAPLDQFFFCALGVQPALCLVRFHGGFFLKNSPSGSG
jgi:hypothetical protein